MRIISKKKDYYDCIMAHDQDRETVYVREPVKVDMQKAFGWARWIFPQFYPDNPPPGMLRIPPAHHRVLRQHLPRS